ncbi:MAG: hypothetical protein WC854_02130 [Bacteroidales bacterium]
MKIRYKNDISSSNICFVYSHRLYGHLSFRTFNRNGSTFVRMSLDNPYY